MSWAEVKKINSNMLESLDVLINRVSARKMKTVYQSISASRATITNNQTVVNVQGTGVFRRIFIMGAVKASDTTKYPNFYVHPGALKIDGVQRYAWNGSEAATFYGGAYIGFQGNVVAWTGSGNHTVSGSPFFIGSTAYGSWPNIFEVDLNWCFVNGFTIDLTALTTPAMAGSGTSTFYLLYDLEV